DRDRHQADAQDRHGDHHLDQRVAGLGARRRVGECLPHGYFQAWVASSNARVWTVPSGSTTTASRRSSLSVTYTAPAPAPQSSGAARVTGTPRLEKAIMGTPKPGSFGRVMPSTSDAIVPSVIAFDSSSEGIGAVLSAVGPCRP